MSPIHPQNTSISIIGPTGAGKTDVAFELARQLGNGEIINFDKMYVYKDFPLSSGMSDSLQQQGVKRHLYAFRGVDEAILPADTYLKMVQIKSAEILADGKVPILEGGSTTYIPKLFSESNLKQFCNPIIGIKRSSIFDLRLKIEQRIQSVLEMGLIEEVRLGIESHPQSVVLNTCIFSMPIIKYLNGLITLDVAKKTIVDACLSYYDYQMKCFERYKEIVWIEDDSSIQETVSVIMAKLSDR